MVYDQLFYFNWIRKLYDNDSHLYAVFFYNLRQLVISIFRNDPRIAECESGENPGYDAS